MYLFLSLYIYIYMYIYREREREIDTCAHIVIYTQSYTHGSPKTDLTCNCIHMYIRVYIHFFVFFFAYTYGCLLKPFRHVIEQVILEVDHRISHVISTVLCSYTLFSCVIRRYYVLFKEEHNAYHQHTRISYANTLYQQPTHIQMCKYTVIYTYSFF